jgi:hypothetical protein
MSLPTKTLTVACVNRWPMPHQCYMCEIGFSTLTRLKTKERHRRSNTLLMPVSLSTCIPDFDEIMKNSQSVSRTHRVRWIHKYPFLENFTTLFSPYIFIELCAKKYQHNAQVFTLCDSKGLRGPHLLLHVSVACIPPSSGRSHSWRLRRHWWGTVLWNGSDDVCVKIGRHLTSGVAASKREISLMMVAYMPPKHVGVKVAP